MAVGFRSASALSKASGFLNTPAAPAGVVAGDLLIAIQICEQSTDLAAMTSPAGWVERFTQAGTVGGNLAVKVWSKTATASETYGFGHPSSSGDCTLSILCFTDAGDDDLDVAVTALGPAGTSHVAPSTTGKVDGMLVCAWGAKQNAGVIPSYTPPSGMTERTDTAASSCYVAMSTATLATTTTAATGTKTATCTRPYDYVALSFVIGPPSAAADTGSLLSFF